MALKDACEVADKTIIRVELTISPWAHPIEKHHAQRKNHHQKDTAGG